jgi:hypothetical protein
MQKHRFVKEDGQWYIDLLEYLQQGGTKGDLQMVAGADTMLDIIAQGKDSVTVTLDTRPFKGADLVQLLQRCDPAVGGGDYFMKTFNGQEVNRQMWLCSVTTFVFGDIPEKIYVRKDGE